MSEGPFLESVERERERQDRLSTALIAGLSLILAVPLFLLFVLAEGRRG